MFTTPPTEPTPQTLRNPFLRYFRATRPQFLSVTLVAALIGLATAYASAIQLDAPLAMATVIFAMVAHAGVNVLNDYYDALNGTDALNTERIFPFTGGSRFIQNRVLTPRETFVFGASLLAVVSLVGIVLTRASAPGLLIIGLLGLSIGWAYSAPPLKFNSRGLGELCVWTGFQLITVGADFVQRGTFSVMPVIAGASYALLVTNILYVNQFPDRRADEAAGKWHWVVRLGPETARWGYVTIVAAAYFWLVAAVVLGALPKLALLALLPACLSAPAAAIVLGSASRPQQLAPAIPMTIAAACGHGLLLVFALGVSAPLA